MNIQRSQEQENFIREKVAAGEHINAEEMISEALKLLGIRSKKIKGLQAIIEIGTEQIIQGKLADGEVVFRKLQEKINRKLIQYNCQIEEFPTA